jgi:hypothetical protein
MVFPLDRLGGGGGADREYVRQERAFYAKQQVPRRYLVGLDLGQRDDWTALAILEHDGAADLLNLVRLERARGMSYPRIARLVRDTMAALPEDSRLLVDTTGVGRPICDQLDELGVAHTKISIHGGAAVKMLDDGTLSAPKRDLVAALVVRMEQATLRIADGLAHAKTLEQEALGFRMTLSPAGHDAYSAREGAHDDLLLAVALPVWWLASPYGGFVGVWFPQD